MNQLANQLAGAGSSSSDGTHAMPRQSVRYPSTQRHRWFRKSLTSLVGIDIDVDEVRVVSLQPMKDRQNCLAWRSWYRFPLPSAPDGEPTTQWLRSVVNRIEAGLPRSIDGDRHIAAISLPTAWTHYQTVSGHELDDVSKRYSEMFRQSVFQSPAQMSHWPVVGTHHGNPSVEDQYVVAAAAENFAHELCERITNSGFTVQSVLPNAVSLAHAAETLTGLKAQMVLWLSQSAALIAVVHRSGVGLTRTLDSVPLPLLSLEQPGRALDQHSLRPYLAAVAEEIQCTTSFAARADMQPPSDLPVLLCGPLAEINGVDSTLATFSRKPVAVWRYAGLTRPTALAHQRKSESGDLPQTDASFANALSLALAAGRTGPRGYCE